MAKKPGIRGSVPQTKGVFFKVFKAKVLDNFKSHFCLHTFGVRRTKDVLDSENQPGSGTVKIRTGFGTGSGALRLTGDVCHQKYENKKEGLYDYL